jgi:hypothetical protein
MGDKPIARPLPTHRTTQSKCAQASMHREGFEATIPVFERAKTTKICTCINMGDEISG